MTGKPYLGFKPLLSSDTGIKSGKRYHQGVPSSLKLSGPAKQQGCASAIASSSTRLASVSEGGKLALPNHTQVSADAGAMASLKDNDESELKGQDCAW